MFGIVYSGSVVFRDSKVDGFCEVERDGVRVFEIC